ncbi:MAG: methyl-accepting chemotaxis protein [Silicimonas sp.]|nr:methyl-accepting chemotaxis protein [Silicimonas sp.]
MTVLTNLRTVLKEASEAQSEGLTKLRRSASKFYLGYLWVMALAVSAVAAGWSAYWMQILAVNIALAAIATFANWKAPDKVQTRATIGGAMLANWMNLVYASSGYANGEFVLDAHMIYFTLNAILLAYFCWRTLALINVVTVVHHIGLNFLAPLLVWPSAEYGLIHLATHSLMATMATLSGLAITITVCRLFGQSEEMVQTLHAEISEREKLEAEESRLRDEAAEREKAEVARAEADRLAAQKAEEAERAREEEARQAQDAAREKEDADRRTRAEEQSKVVDALAKGLQKLSEGNLDTSIDHAFPEAYEGLRVDFNKTVSSLSGLIREIAGSIETINSSSQEVASASDDLARRTERSAATLEETSAAVEEFSVSVRSAADGATQANVVTTEASQKASESREVVTGATDAMGEIEESSREISKISDVIDEIAFQTNLLALNAGVEAARAGDAGKGFAVVASEVRALAQRSAGAAKEINSLIAQSNSQVENGARLVGTAGRALNDIIAAVTQIAGNVEAIATSSQEQAAGIQEVNTAVSDLDRTMQQNAAMTEETTAATQILSTEAERLNRLISEFTLSDAVHEEEEQGVEAA